MHEPAGKILKLVCLILAALVVYELAQIVPRVNPLAGVRIPDLPTLPQDKTNAVAGGTNAIKVAGGGTNAGTNLVAIKSTNAPVKTNALAGENKTNRAPATNVVVLADETNVVQAAGTNSAVSVDASNGGPVSVKMAGAGTNLVSGANVVALGNLPPGVNISNIVAAGGAVGPGGRPRRGRNGPGGPMMPGMPGGRGAPLADLPPDIKARINRVYESEILGQIMHPMPKGLMGIAGDMAFLRSSSGQTGMVKEGDSLGNLKLLKIGINRVLVEEDGKKSELMIFDGYGGTSLMTEETNSAPPEAKPAKPARRRDKSAVAEEKDKP